jgi:hypothetical protein
MCHLLGVTFKLGVKNRMWYHYPMRKQSTLRSITQLQSLLGSKLILLGELTNGALL